MSKIRAINRSRGLPRLTLLLLLAAAPILGTFVPNLGTLAHADVYTVNVGPNTVRLFDEPCATSTVWLKLKRAEMRFEGKLYAACWVVLKTVVLVFDEAGDITPIVVAAFRKEEGV